MTVDGGWTDTVLSAVKVRSITFGPSDPPILYVSTQEGLIRYMADAPRGGEETSTGVDEETRSAEVPTAFSLSQNHPNPFNSETSITYGVATTGTIRLSVYALTGQHIRTLVDGERPAGSYSVIWDGKDDAGQSVSSGVYLYRLNASGRWRETKKMLLVR